MQPNQMVVTVVMMHVQACFNTLPNITVFHFATPKNNLSNYVKPRKRLRKQMVIP